MQTQTAATKLRVWMATANVSATDIAKRLAVSRSYLSHLRQGTRGPGRALAVKIAAITDGAVPVDAWDAPGLPAGVDASTATNAEPAAA